MWTEGIQREGGNFLVYCQNCKQWVTGVHNCNTANGTYTIDATFPSEEIQLLREIRDLLKQLIAKESPL